MRFKVSGGVDEGMVFGSEILLVAVYGGLLLSVWCDVYSYLRCDV